MSNSLERFSKLSAFSALLYSFILFSPFSFFAFSVGGNYYVEIAAFICFLIGLLLRDQLYDSFKKSLLRSGRKAQSIVFLIFFVFLLGCIIGGSVVNSYSDFRASLAIVFGFLFALYCHKNGQHKNLLLLCFFCIVFYILNWLILFYYNQLDVKYNAPYIAAIVGIYISTLIKSFRSFLTFTICLVFLSAVSFYRQNWIAAACAVAYGGLFFFEKTNFLRKARLMTLLFSTLLVFSLFQDQIVSNVGSFYTQDESRYIQSVGKTNDVLEFLSGSSKMSESDAIRLGYFEYVVQQPHKLIFPHGLGYKSVFNNIDQYFNQFSIEANTIDSFAFFVIYHYGLFVFLIFAFWLLMSFRSHSFKAGIFKTGLIFAPMLIIMLFDGGSAVVINKAFFFGIYCGLILIPIDIKRIL